MSLVSSHALVGGSHGTASDWVVDNVLTGHTLCPASESVTAQYRNTAHACFCVLSEMLFSQERPRLQCILIAAEGPKGLFRSEGRKGVIVKCGHFLRNTTSMSHCSTLNHVEAGSRQQTSLMSPSVAIASISACMSTPLRVQKLSNAQ